MDGLAHGQGVWITTKGNRYEGQWKFDKLEGEATYTCKEYTETAVFRKSVRNGPAVKTFTDGRTAEVFYVDNKRQGPTKITWPSGTVFLGEFVDDARQLHGEKHYSDGSIYRGQVDIKTCPHGQGIWEFPDGRRYEGQVKEGYLCGIGVMTFPDGTRQEGRFEKDEYIGPAEPVSEEGGV